MKNRIQALLYEDSGKEWNVFNVDELSTEIDNFLFRYNKRKWKRLKDLRGGKGLPWWKGKEGFLGHFDK